MSGIPAPCFADDVGLRQFGFTLLVGHRGSLGNHEMAKVSPFKFLQEVRQEAAKITWPSRRETLITTAMVFVFAAVAGVFFLLADQAIRLGLLFCWALSVK